MLKLEPADPFDIEALAQLYLEARAALEIDVTPEYVGGRSDGFYHGLWEDTFKPGSGYKAHVLWEALGHIWRPIGFSRVGPVDDYAGKHALEPDIKLGLPPKTGEIHQLYMLPGYKGAGHGLKLARAAAQDLRALGYEHGLACIYQKNVRARKFAADLAAQHLRDAAIRITDAERGYYWADCSFYVFDVPPRV